MNTATPTVYVIDDDAGMCEALAYLLRAEGLHVQTYLAAEDFLQTYTGEPGCLLLDVRMRGMSGLELQSRLAGEHPSLPIIILTAHGDIRMAVRAMKDGAVDFLEKPVPDQILVQRIRSALELDWQRRSSSAETRQVLERLNRLTRREREVLWLVVSGLANKQIASQLDITEKTVEAHRKHVMQKMGVHNAVALVRTMVNLQRSGEPLPDAPLTFSAETEPPPGPPPDMAPPAPPLT
jgi:FixJ family two-component response regulator